MAMVGLGPEGVKMIQNTSCVEFNRCRKNSIAEMERI